MSRINIFPSPMALKLMDQKKENATKGRDLLKLKAEALTLRFRQLMKELRANKELIAHEIKSCNQVMAGVRYQAGNINAFVREGLKGEATFRVDVGEKNLKGVWVPEYHRAESSKVIPTMGLAKGGAKIQDARNTYIKALETILKLASQQTEFVKLDNVIKATNRRVNALDHIVLPKITNTIEYIFTELQERAREDTYRIKLIKKKKPLAAQRQAAEIAEFHGDEKENQNENEKEKEAEEEVLDLIAEADIDPDLLNIN